MSLSVDIVKRGGKRQTEHFVREKLHASIVAACLSVRTPEGQAEATAHAVCDAVIAWLRQRPEVTSHDLRVVAARHLKSHHPEAAYIYEQHRNTI
ncbi:MAG TPA: ATP cone domain-containing protein [Candidatus Saccharimonadales bacterium]|nr:ATP cone domain-containing protein [Candidatus Saccharimonadales bacterium]